MRLLRMRNKGEILTPTCVQCSAVLKVGAGQNKALEQGLCWACYKKSDEARLERRRQALAREEVWGVGYWSAKPGEELAKHQRLRAAIGYAYVARGQENGPVYVAWSDGQVTEHHGLTAANSRNLTPDHPSRINHPPVQDPSWFLDQIPPNRSAWFKGGQTP